MLHGGEKVPGMAGKCNRFVYPSGVPEGDLEGEIEMSHISIMIGGEITVHPLHVNGSGDFLQSIDIAFDLPGNGYPYDRTQLGLHGTPKEILRFVDAISENVRSSMKEAQAEKQIAAEGLDAAGMKNGK